MNKTKVLRMLFVALTIALVASVGSTTVMAQEADTLVTVTVTAGVITWEPEVETGGLVLTVSGPGGLVVKEEVPAGESATFEAAGRAEGVYTYELLLLPVGAPAASSAAERGLTPTSPPVVVSGSFSIAGGRFVPIDLEEADTGGAPALRAPSDVLHYDDVIITGSLCVGFDCVDGESFGYSTIKLKENNLQFTFEDTSVGTFPTNDWKIQANDTTSGGASYLTVWDVDGGRRPFTIEAGAPAHSLYVEDYGRVGLGTSIPYVELHIVDGDSPTLRLDQDGSSGWSPQVWDMCGNETNFFIRDVTNGSKLSFRIQPNTPSNTLSLRSTGNVGIGTWSPSETLEVEGSDASTSIRVEELNGSTSARTLLNLVNNGPVRTNYTNANTGITWIFGTTTSDHFAIIKQGTPTADWQFELEDNGDLTIDGTLTENSDVNAKEDIVPVDGAEILATVAELPIATWSYKDDPGVRHLGPMAQDFHAAFGLGEDGTGIATLDTSGVALAAIQALEARVAELESAQSASPTVLPWLLLAVAMLGAGLALGKRLYGKV